MRPIARRPRRSWGRWRTGSLAAASHLLRGPVANQALMDEARPWLVAFELGARADPGHRGPWLRQAHWTHDAASVLRPFLVRLRRARVRVFGDALEMTLSDLTGIMFRPGEVPEIEGGDT